LWRESGDTDTGEKPKKGNKTGRPSQKQPNEVERVATIHSTKAREPSFRSPYTSFLLLPVALFACDGMNQCALSP